jgi:hypothetical protein
MILAVRASDCLALLSESKSQYYFTAKIYYPKFKLIMCYDRNERLNGNG